MISYDDYVACKGERGAREAGRVRLEGKGYVVREGDVKPFRFNVSAPGRERSTLLPWPVAGRPLAGRPLALLPACRDDQVSRGEL